MVLVPIMAIVSLTMPQALASAQRDYGPAPCGQPVIQVDESFDWDTEHEAIGYVNGIGNPLDCTIHVLKSSVEDDGCAVVRHEYRHLVGQKHDLTGITGPKPKAEYDPACIVDATFYVPFTQWDTITADDMNYLNYYY